MSNFTNFTGNVAQGGKDAGIAIGSVLGGFLGPLGGFLGTTQSSTVETPVSAQTSKTWTTAIAVLAVATVLIVGYVLISSNKSNS